MSNGILYDPLLVHYLARELDQRLRGRACAAAPVFAADRAALLPLDRGEALSLDLHPHRGWIRIVPWESDPEELDALCLGVEAPVDERLLRIRLHAGDRFRAQSRQLVVELASNQWNALLVSEDDGRVVSALWERTAGSRVLRAGAAYQPPPGRPRFGSGEVIEVEARSLWRMSIGTSALERRRAELLSGFAFTGSANADALLGEAASSESESAVWEAFDRWWRIRSLPVPEPVLLRAAGRPLPYPLPLPGIPAERVASLLEGMERAATELGNRPDGATPAPSVAALRGRVAAAARRVERLEAQLARAGEAEGMRLWGDLLLARKRLVPRGVDSVRLQDWSGKLVEVPLDPTLSVTENADRLYEEARKRQRADERIPGMLEQARAEQDRWQVALEAAERGEVPDWVADKLRESPAPRTGGSQEPGLPYRRYRTSGGLEVRVGRSARDNDQLTFGHSSPNDVWLHARSVPGSHVILRWQTAQGSPPARDLEEAAGLAALFSRARSSALVPVDWTRRKYVRKPRGAPPGSVIPQQVRTLFVEPDASLEDRLRAD